MFDNQERIWVVGAQGQVGSSFLKLIDRTAVELFATDIEDIDVTDSDSVKMFTDMNRPQIIINCAGLTDPKRCREDKDEAFRVNALGARNLSVAARSVNARMVQISTDDVFNGKLNIPFDEFDSPKPLSVYGKSKLAGENFVKDIAPKHLIIRSSWVYGQGNNFLSHVIRKAKKGEEIIVSSGQFATPTPADSVAKIIYHLLMENSYGTYHATCQGFCSRYEFAKKITELAGFTDAKVSQQFDAPNAKAALRPNYTVLDNMMLRISGFDLLPNWEDCLTEYMQANLSDILEKEAM